jgi:hypothetical protein
MAIDARAVTTPVGAVLGLLAVRGLLPEKARTATNYAIGGGVGAGTGYIGGEYARAYGEPIKQSLMGLLGKATQEGSSAGVQRKAKVLQDSADIAPGSEASSVEADIYQDLLGQKNYETGDVGDSPSEVVDIDPFSAHHPGRPVSFRRQDYRNRLHRFRNELSERRAKFTGNTDAAAEARKEVQSATPPDRSILQSLFRYGAAEPIIKASDWVATPK